MCLLLVSLLALQGCPSGTMRNPDLGCVSNSVGVKVQFNWSESPIQLERKSNSTGVKVQFNWSENPMQAKTRKTTNGQHSKNNMQTVMLYEFSLQKLAKQAN
jgi:hypothetical protein